MIGDGGRTIGYVHLTRPRSARPFTVDDVQRLDRLRPWLAHAFRRSPSADARQEDKAPIGTAGPTVLSGQLIATADGKLVYQTAGLEHLLRILTEIRATTRASCQPATGCPPGSETSPADHWRREWHLQRAASHADFDRLWRSHPRSEMARGLPARFRQTPPGNRNHCLISVTIELHEHPIAQAARVLRESGATPAQTKVGIHLAFGKPKPIIADELGIQLSSVADHTKRLYQILDVHNSTELGAKSGWTKKARRAKVCGARDRPRACASPANAAKISPVHASS